MARFLTLFAFILFVFNPNIIPWIGNVTGITNELISRGLLSGNVITDTLVVIAVIVFLPVFVSLLIVGTGVLFHFIIRILLTPLLSPANKLQ